MIHTGLVVKKLLKEKGLRQGTVARVSKMQESYLSELLNGRRPMVIPLAYGLETLGLETAQYWLHRWADFELAVWKELHPEKLREGDTKPSEAYFKPRNSRGELS